MLKKLLACLVFVLFAVSGLAQHDGRVASERMRVTAGARANLNEPGPKQPIFNVEIITRDRAGKIVTHEWNHNLRPNAGINWAYNQLFGTTAAVGAYIGLSNDGTTPGATDTSIPSEITSNGLARANGTCSWSHTTNATSAVLGCAWTFTGTSQSVQKAGLFNASTAGSGTLIGEDLFTQIALSPSVPTLNINWTWNF
jgi:hypothetical protein